MFCWYEIISMKKKKFFSSSTIYFLIKKISGWWRKDILLCSRVYDFLRIVLIWFPGQSSELDDGPIKSGYTRLFFSLRSLDNRTMIFCCCLVLLFSGSSFFVSAAPSVCPSVFCTVLIKPLMLPQTPDQPQLCHSAPLKDQTKVQLSLAQMSSSRLSRDGGAAPNNTGGHLALHWSWIWWNQIVVII